MKPAPFRYAAARSVADALALLAEEDAVPLAGGQSLVPMLNFRLARPALLVDLNPIGELTGIVAAEPGLRIGAMTRQATLERSAVIARDWPLLRDAVRLVAHPAVRSRGTVGGSLAQADPRAELPVALSALDARFVLRSPRGSRTLTSAELHLGPMSTQIAGDELLCEIELPPPPRDARMAFVEHARTHASYPLAAAAVVIAGDRGGAIALLGAGPTPQRAADAERALGAGAPTVEVARLAAAAIDDAYQRALVEALVTRALEAAGR